MANLLNQLTIDNVNYDLYDSEFIIDTRTASGAALTGVSHAPELFDGMQITFWMSYAAASNATLNLTLADGTTTGAIPCYYSGTTRLGTNYAAGNAIRFIYRENVTIGSTTIAAGWWSDANYTVSDTNYDIVGVSIPIKTRLNAYCLCAMVGTSGTIAKQTRTAGAGTYWEINAFTQSSGTGQTKKLIPNQGYYPGKLFYHTGSSAITDTDAVSGTISGGTNNFDLRYTVNGSSSANIGVTGAPFFLVGSIGSDGLFYPNGHASEAIAEWWQCGFPTDLTSTYVYWYVGMMTSKYQCRLSDENWMLKSDGTKWIVFDGAKKVHWDNIEGKPPIPDLPDAPSNDGNYSLNVLDGTTSWTTASGGPNTPDAPALDGNYVLNVNSGNSSWQEETEEIFNITATPVSANNFTTNVLYDDFLTAVSAGNIVQVSIPSMSVSGILTSKDSDYYTFNMFDGYNAVIWVFAVSEDQENHKLLFTSVYQGYTSRVSFPDTAGLYLWDGNNAWVSETKITEFSQNGFNLVCTDGTTYEDLANALNQNRRCIAKVGFIHINLQAYSIYQDSIWCQSILTHPSNIWTPGVYSFRFFNDTQTSTLKGYILTVYYYTTDTPVVGLSGGDTPSITYSTATASRASLTNGLLSFGDVTASNITNWSAGSMPTPTYGELPYVGAALNID